MINDELQILSQDFKSSLLEDKLDAIWNYTRLGMRSKAIKLIRESNDLHSIKLMLVSNIDYEEDYNCIRDFFKCRYINIDQLIALLEQFNEGVNYDILEPDENDNPKLIIR